MPNLSIRSYQKELLDGKGLSFEDIKRNMQELEFINHYLGGHAITILGIRKIVARHQTDYSPSHKLHIAEIGCGGGDNLKAINRWCQSHHIPVQFTGIDINNECITYARENAKDINAEWITSDYKEVQFTSQPDIIFSSLFCHHFTDEELIDQLQWMKQASRGFFINDLHRHPLAYQSIKILTSLFSKSYLVKHDAPLSVWRGFTRNEWISLLEAAGIKNFSIEWKWAIRWLIYAEG